MKKSNLIDYSEVLETAFEIKYGRPCAGAKDNTKWNNLCDGIDGPDGVAFSECGSFDYDIDEVKEGLEEDPDSIFYKTIEKLMKENKVKSITLVKD